MGDKLKLSPELETALEGNARYQRGVKNIAKLTQKFGDSAKVNADATNSMSQELMRVVADDWVKSSPTLDMAKYFRYFSTTIKAVGCVQEKFSSQVQSEVFEVLNNFVDYDFLATAELKKKVAQTQSEYDSTCAKIESAFTGKKKSKKAELREQQIMEFERSLEKLRLDLDETQGELQGQQDELGQKKETKVLRTMLHLLELQLDYHQKAVKLLQNLKPKMDALAEQLGEPVESALPYKEGHLHRKGQGIGGGWEKCFYVLKEGQLYCYRGKKDTQVDQSFNIMLCTTRINPSKKDVFEIVTPDKKKPIVLQAENQIERDHWVKVIQDAISESLNTGSAENIDSTRKHAKTVNKGKPSQEDTRNLKIVNARPGNMVCADCNTKEPDWASINLGVLLCLDCSGVHRSLGTHITKVRSMTLDTKSWEPELMWFMRSVGNDGFNSVYECNRPEDFVKPRSKAEREMREAFIKRKYIDKEFLVEPTVQGEDSLSMELYNHIVSTGDDVLGVLALLGQGASISWKHPYDDEKCAMHAAVIYDRVLYLECLIQNGGNVFAQNNRMWTPMHFAAQLGRTHCASVLCKHGFSKKQLEYKTDENKTAVELAFINNCQDIITLLRDEPVENLHPTLEEMEELSFQEHALLEEQQEVEREKQEARKPVPTSRPQQALTKDSLSAVPPQMRRNSPGNMSLPSLPGVPGTGGRVTAPPPLAPRPASGEAPPILPPRPQSMTGGSGNPPPAFPPPAAAPPPAATPPPATVGPPSHPVLPRRATGGASFPPPLMRPPSGTGPPPVVPGAAGAPPPTLPPRD